MTSVTGVTPPAYPAPIAAPATDPAAAHEPAIPAPAAMPAAPAPPAPSQEAIADIAALGGVRASVAPPANLVVAFPDKAGGLLDAMNAARKKEGLTELVFSAALAEVAQARADDLIRNDYFAHYSAGGQSAFSELAARGIGYRLAGENLARNNYAESKTLDIAFDALMASPGHRANILEPRFTKAGVVAVRDGKMFIYVTVFKD